MNASNRRQGYAEFLASRSQISGQHGFAPTFVPDWLFDFQKKLVEWSVSKGKSAIFADCGMGKGPMQLVWAENVVRHTNKPVLVVTPLAVSHQITREGTEKFSIDCERNGTGKIASGARIVVTNYERLHLFDATQFAGCVCDESSILKNESGVRRATVTEFLRTINYRLLCTATAAPNDYIELGTSSEALGEMGHLDMLMRFFKNEQNSLHANRNWMDGGKWRFKHHAAQPFWRWVCSWARAMRKPSDMGFADGRFVLPPLTEKEHVVETARKRPGMLFTMPAANLREQREERRLTIDERCVKIADLTRDSDSALVWCHLNQEGDELTRIIPGAVQISGTDSDEIKEERLLAFAAGQVRVLVTKPKIGAWGLNLQHCAHVTFFPSHSYEQYYQGVRRCWRFGQKRPVRVDVVATEGERGVMQNLQRKAIAADAMFASLAEHMHDALHLARSCNYPKQVEVPSWLS